ncbi:MAG: ERCC4 domain-containing protein [Clostridiales bacterium]|nr:ERCC4 domain-containing protein [Clostridiales bacterium]MBQ1572060.1 ERCC4 domain-containing protein [Clostridiales bacterium]
MKDKYIIVDTREKPKAITKILDYFDQHQIKHVSSKLLFGDYMDFNRPGIVIDRKQNVAELAKNCTIEHERLKEEIKKAIDANSHLVILVEQNVYKDRKDWIYIHDISDLMRWSSPHTQVTGEKVFRILASWCAKYPVSVQFCDKRSTGRRIVEILYDTKTEPQEGNK